VTMGRVPLHCLFSAVSALLPLAVGIYGARRYRIDMKIFLFFCGMAAFLEGLTLWMAFAKYNNLWLSHFWTLFEFTSLAYIISLWQNSFMAARIIRLSIPVFWLFSFVEVIFGNFNAFNTFSKGFASLFLALIAAYSLINLDTKDERSLRTDFRMWMLSGILLYYSGNLVILAGANVVLQHFRKLWLLHSILNILANLLYAGGFFWARLQQRSGGRFSLVRSF